MKINFPEKLAFLVNNSARYKVIYGGRSAGKCLGLGTKVIMYDGSLKKVEDIWAGDLLMGPDSLPRKVLGTTRGRSQMYKVNQISGISYVVNSAHILSLKKSESAVNDLRIMKSGNPRSPKGRYPNYPKITNINVVEAYNQSNRWKANFRGYKAGLLEFKEKSVSIDPWYLGLWLGDGKNNDTIVYTADEEILKGCEEYAARLWARISIYEQPNNKSVGVAIRRIFNYKKIANRNILYDKFIASNLFGNKHIPKEYIVNSENIRLELLAGLIDSDGYLHNNGYEIAQTNERLAREIKYLADTLGFKTYLVEKKTVCSNNGVVGKAFRVTINGDTWRIPCRVKRKIVKKENVNKIRDFLLSSIDIEPIGEGEYAGFSLDGDHLFLLEDGTVTHNTETVALSLIILARSRKLRIACFRELQKSIDESVYQTLKNRIIDLCDINNIRLEDEWDIQKTTIINLKTGSEFIFSGLRYQINSIKSLARIDIAWIEEATNCSRITWERLPPTIRGKHEDDPNGQGGPFKKGPEIWITFNPELDTDETYKRFVLERDKWCPEYITDNGKQERYSFVLKLNYDENPFLPKDSRIEMEVMRAADEDEWLHVWEGHTKQTLTGAIYTKEIKQTLLDGRRGKVGYNLSKPVHTFWDLGHANHTSIWFVQHAGVEFNIINFYQNRLEKVPHYLEYLQSLKYNYGFHYLPHDGDTETLTNVSMAKQVRLIYPGKVKIVPRVSKKVHAINAVKSVFPLCNFDEELTADGWQALCRYAYKVDEDGKFSNEPDHNEYSDASDGFACFAQSLKPEQESKKKPRTVGSGNVVNIPTANSWMRHL